ncbi:nucleoside triphosphate pyrophosphohydrolase family protein [Halomonas sp. C05BenzN]|uniref:nucleoside triphosphate pyrophosphohydrolase family protein n=1 Tax=Halomonas sp. C05BenzN TaxID=3411041 RepID=UPI003B92A5EE
MDDDTSISFLRQYELSIEKTDRFSKDEITPILMGLYGEVGSIMATSKKYYREKKAYVGHKAAVEEEFGDAFWYLSALCRRLDINIERIVGDLADDKPSIKKTSSTLESKSTVSKELDAALIDLGCAVTDLLIAKENEGLLKNEVLKVACLYGSALRLTGLEFRKVVEDNLIKTLGRFSEPDLRELDDFDEAFPKDEQLPRYFEIHITQRKSGFSYLKWNGVFIGDPLTDNISKPDGYRFHDVFHMAHAAVLHWSPTLRALIKQKRKSDPTTDRDQDGGRAIVVEEGLTAWLFSYAQGLDNFEGHDGVSFDVLKTIQKFVQGYEVERCPLKLWENAILQGYAVFRELKKNNGGIVVGNRDNRTLEYRPIGESHES